MERCTCDDSPGLESRQAWQWGVCGDNLKYSTKFLSNFLGPKRGSKDLRARADAHNTHVGIKVSEYPPYCPKCHARQGASTAGRRPALNTRMSRDELRVPFSEPSLHITGHRGTDSQASVQWSQAWLHASIKQERGVWKDVSIPTAKRQHHLMTSI